MRKKWKKWLAAACMPLAVLVMVGCSTGTGDDDDDDDNGTPSQSQSPTPPQFEALVQVLVVGRFGLSNDGAGTIALRDYTAEDQLGADVLVPISLDMILLNQAQDQFCILSIEQDAAGLSGNGWTTNPITPAFSATNNGIPYTNAALEFNMATATTGNDSCAGLADPAIWGTNPEEGIRNATYGAAGHDDLDASIIDAMNGSNAGTGDTDGMGQITDPTEWNNEWENRMSGGSPLFGGLAVNGAWGFRIATVDGAFKIVAQSWVDTTALDPANEPEGAYVMFTPFVIGFGGGDEAQLASVLLGTASATADPPKPEFGGPANWEELGIDPFNMTKLQR